MKKELAKRKETSEKAWEGQHFKYLFIFYAVTRKVKLGGKACLGLYSESFL